MQMVEIAKALLNQFSVLILDEPTASLTTRETEQLFKTIRSLKAEGKSIIYISHRLDEIFEICDRATVLRDGRYVGTSKVAGLTKAALIRMMTERDISSARFNVTTNRTDEVVLAVRNFSDGKRFRDINFELHRGEILGFSGLVGAGRTELMRAIFGADRKESGSLAVRGRAVAIRSPRDAIRAGVMLIPEDRKLQGFVGGMSNHANVALSDLKRFTSFGVLNFRKRNRAVDQITKTLNVHPDDNTLQTARLSGGNQQKVVVARELARGPAVLLAGQPTRGVDIGAIEAIHDHVRAARDAGLGVLLVSADLGELQALADRILVMVRGRIVAEFDGATASLAALGEAMLGATATAAAADGGGAA